ncbi:hypothetical protein QUB80_06915 [Chlorogloeopsis sp. ULAP01]|nr:hypothetical protein [Chlorogloeopsis sp. ULAP01]MDM9380432.1 hypothetical protein [Chlorogloeopsis sp. ULAP01]
MRSVIYLSLFSNVAIASTIGGFSVANVKIPVLIQLFTKPTA